VFLASHETGIVDEEIRFKLTPEQERQARRLVSPSQSGLLMWMGGVMSCVYAAQVIALVASHRGSAIMLGLYSVSCVVWAVLAITYARQRSPKLARSGELRISACGIEGTLNGKPATIPWRQISAVRDVGDFLAFTPRRTAPPIAVPKASLHDTRATWAFLEEHLVSKRGLIRSSPAPTFIANTAF